MTFFSQDICSPYPDLLQPICLRPYGRDQIEENWGEGRMQRKKQGLERKNKGKDKKEISLRACFKETTQPLGEKDYLQKIRNKEVIVL